MENTTAAKLCGKFSISRHNVEPILLLGFLYAVNIPIALSKGNSSNVMEIRSRLENNQEK